MILATTILHKLFSPRTLPIKSFKHRRMHSKIPTIDFKPFLDGCPEEKRQIASQMDTALRTFGSLRLQNHGIDEKKIENCFKWVNSMAMLF